MNKIHNTILGRYTQFPNGAIIDPRLSDGAVRLFLYLCSKSGLEWSFNNSDIKKQLDIKRDETIAKYFKELMSSGWISRTTRIKDGRPSGYFDYTLYFEPIVPATTKKADLHNNVTTKNADTENQQLPENSSLNNTEIKNKIENKNTPSSPTHQEKNRAGEVWLQMAENLKFLFNNEEQTAISRWAEYKTTKQRTITILQIETDLQNLFKLKTDGYDICSMINDTISAGYKWLLKPSPIYLVKNLAGKLVAASKQHSYRYNNPDYFVPENKADKLELRDYIERCYMRELVDPRTKLPLTPKQKNLFKAHFDFAKTKRIGITDYIYQYEVLSGKCLLEQSINGLAAALIGVAE
ncbi:MAG TPA: hypothetical protein PLP75_06435 [Burkholderiales bacterium]|nr:hypothetical protein [Burkholderiales bacterium]